MSAAAQASMIPGKTASLAGVESCLPTACRCRDIDGFGGCARRRDGRSRVTALPSPCGGSGTAGRSPRAPRSDGRRVWGALSARGPPSG